MQIAEATPGAAVAGPAPQLRLVVTQGLFAGTTVGLGDMPQLLGRHPSADIRLDDVTVSLRHAVIRPSSDGFPHIVDLGSLNGTYVNGERVDAAPLRARDEIRIGRSRIYVLPTSTTVLPDPTHEEGSDGDDSDKAS